MNKHLSVIEVKNLHKSYNHIKAVNGISFKVFQGEVFGILGPNGAGKTTTLEIIETLRRPDKGEIMVAGLNVQNHSHEIKEKIGVQLQSSYFFDFLSLRELLNLFASFYKKKIDPLEILAKVELTDKADSWAKHLSGGQKQRFSIAAALVNKPKILFLDEPTTGLDPQARHHLWEVIRRQNQEGITIVLTTHYMEEAEELCHRVAIMDQGKIIAIDTPNNLIKNLLQNGFKKEKIVQQANLEDVFLHLTGRQLRE
ncbi:ABC transporter ATP-binding protein [candidate division CPR3 bacterium 4484_211]|uniref:ABC transporter ATP-binding protein n=1 Tax=candidate division CPR3 bacterium 4484_211 TaxID=1968527 RepID=A0A1W9NYP8_UNCC3|nr:MAG: ABC transporter ATP-binding protein [candidate division CPR3 bacterium 4484_211]RLB76833.1 MAG: ABC transporter ATP-binding protein [Deltaproteobacteria bacterium]